MKNKRPGRKPKRGRHAVHYDTVPHNPCYDPQHCDCECSGCMTAYANWLVKKAKEVAEQMKGIGAGGATYYVPSRRTGKLACLHCEQSRQEHQGKHLSCPLIVVYSRVSNA